MADKYNIVLSYRAYDGLEVARILLDIGIFGSVAADELVEQYNKITSSDQIPDIVRIEWFSAAVRLFLGDDDVSFVFQKELVS